MAPLSKTDIFVAADDDSSTTTFEGENLAIYDQAKRKRRSSLVTPDIKKSRSSSKSRKSVQWAKFADQVEIPNDLTEQEKRRSWFQDEDYQRIAQENSKTVQAMNGGVFPDSQDETFRGLENHMDSYMAERHYLIDTAVHSVLREQERLLLLDPIWVDHVYSRFTAQAMVPAARAGQFDARVAAQCA